LKRIRAKKRYGQNFLKNGAVIEKIIQSMPATENVVVEIGPGLGDLTKKLLHKKDVIAFEIDEELCDVLRSQFKDELTDGSLSLHCGDVLESWNGNLVDEPYDLVANLPYYIATGIVLRALRDRECKNILVMLQKEVAQKFAAKEGEREFSALSVLAQSCGESKRLFDISPDSFDPPPKVTSSVLLIKKERSLEEREFEEFLKRAFSAPRKRLLKNLSSRYEKQRLLEIFAQLNVPENIRPHEATTSIYHRLYEILEQRKIDGKKSTEPAIAKTAKKS